jgi:serine/threonine protein phosphatase PrpC
MLYCINVGDSRAILCRRGRAIDLSRDHSASTNTKEKKRVKESGGVIVGGRLGGRLAVTRAFGDFDLKVKLDETGDEHFKDYLTVAPEIR